MLIVVLGFGVLFDYVDVTKVKYLGVVCTFISACLMKCVGTQLLYCSEGSGYGVELWYYAIKIIRYS